MARKGEIFLRTNRTSNMERLFIIAMGILLENRGWGEGRGSGMCGFLQKEGVARPLGLTYSAYASLRFAHSWPESRDFVRMGLPSLFSAMLLEAVNMFMDNVSLLPFKSHSRPPTSRR